ncbi:MAG TPA: MerR family transcriptional regulator [Propylenella sp.]|nr:MerR family transcriptional regulator [Propylenella sp.]
MKAPDAFRTISEVAEDLDLPQHVLRFWETRFNQIKPLKRGGGRRYYRPEDVDLLRGIRLLLYSEGFTIRGVQRLLKEKGVAFVAGVGQSGSVQTVSSATDIESGSPTRPSRPPARRPEPEAAAAAAAPDRGFETSAPTGGDGAPSRTVAPAQLPGGAIVLTLEKRRRIETALADLLEAKRLLDQVR